MLPLSVPPPAVTSGSAMRALLRAGLLTAVVDGLFSSVLTVFAYGSTVTRLFQGVAATLLDRAALDGGLSTAAVGVLMHVGVAFGWSAVFVFVVMRAAAVRALLGSRHGAIAVAALYGPFIWIVMSLAVIPLLTGRPPSLTGRWWIQFVGHVPFVGLPIAAATRSGVRPPNG